MMQARRVPRRQLLPLLATKQKRVIQQQKRLLRLTPPRLETQQHKRVRRLTLPKPIPLANNRPTRKPKQLIIRQLPRLTQLAENNPRQLRSQNEELAQRSFSE